MTIEEHYLCECGTEVYVEMETRGRSVKRTVHHLGHVIDGKSGVRLVQVDAPNNCYNRGDDWGTVCLIESCKKVTPEIVHGWRCASHQSTTEPTSGAPE